MSEEAYCNECVYWEELSREVKDRLPDDFEGCGVCHRHAPTTLKNGIGVFPITNGHFWCGDGKEQVNG